MKIDIPDQIDNILPKKDGFRRIAWFNPYRTGVDYYGYFHRWGDATWSRGERRGIVSGAIIEKEDGEICFADLSDCQVQFIDKL